MKHIHTFLSVLLLCAIPLFAYEPPSEAKLDQLLANPKLIGDVVGDASGEEAAVLMTRIIKRVEDSDLGKAQKEYLIAYYTSRITFLLPQSERSRFATDVVAAVSQDLVPTVFAGLSIGGGASETFLTHLNDLAGENEIFVTAIQNPNVALTNPVYNLLVATLSTSQALPPPAVDSLPPPITTGEEVGGAPAPAPAPPVADTYDGQG